MNRLGEPSSVPYVGGRPGQPLPLAVLVEMAPAKCVDCGAAVRVHRPTIRGARKTLARTGLGLHVICHDCAELLKEDATGKYVGMIVTPGQSVDQQQGDLQ